MARERIGGGRLVGRGRSLQSHRLERRVVNAGFSVRLPRNLEFFFDVANLCDEPQRTTHLVSGHRMSTYYNGPFASFGLNDRF